MGHGHGCRTPFGVSARGPSKGERIRPNARAPRGMTSYSVTVTYRDSRIYSGMVCCVLPSAIHWRKFSDRKPVLEAARHNGKSLVGVVGEWSDDQLAASPRPRGAPTTTVRSRSTAAPYELCAITGP